MLSCAENRRIVVSTRVFADHNCQRSWRRRQTDRRALATTRRFEADLSFHAAVASVSAGEEGIGQKCYACHEPIYGVLCLSSQQKPLHWACAGRPRPDGHGTVRLDKVAVKETKTVDIDSDRSGLAPKVHVLQHAAARDDSVRHSGTWREEALDMACHDEYRALVPTREQWLRFIALLL